MTLKGALLILCNILYQIQCDDQNTTDLEYNEIRLKHGDPIDYEAFIKKILAHNKSKSAELGTAWEDFTDQTHLLIDLPMEDAGNETTTKKVVNNYWNIPHGAQFLTFPPDNESTTLASSEDYVTTDLTDFTFVNWTFSKEKLFYEQRDLTRDTRTTPMTTISLDYADLTEHDMIFRANDSWLCQLSNLTSEEKKKLKLDDFMVYTMTTKPPPPSTWNPFLIQSEERRELDRQAKEKRMATNNAVREAMKSGQFGGLGGLFGGLGGLGGVIPINLGGLGNLMGGLRTITIVMGGGTTKPKGSTTTPRSTISRKTFRPRPDPKDIMAWKYLEDGSPRPPMPESEFIRILKKHGTPPPYHVPIVSIPAHIDEDMLENLIPDENTTLPFHVEADQLDRIHNFINPFIQQHTAMDLLNVDTNLGRFTAPPKTTPGRTTATVSTSTTTTTTRRTVQTRIFTTEDPHITHPSTEAWKTGWSRTYFKVDPFDKEHIQQELNEGRKGDHPWKTETLKKLSTFPPNPDPRLGALEKDMVPEFFRDAQLKRKEQAEKAKAEVDRRREKYKEKGITKPPYWKEVIFKRPVEPLFDETTTTAPKTEELKAIINMLSKNMAASLNVPSSTTKPTETKTHSTNPIYNWANRYDNIKKTESDADKVTSTERYWTTPLEDKARLNTLLDFIFPYVEKKSDIFKTPTASKEKLSTVESTSKPWKPAESTKFDPWEDSNEDKPDMPEWNNLFKVLAVSTTTEYP
ncbi:hypothetical protein M8J76_013380 [Diaphorina citri]|nr:hypothetical protein M8J76_013380 [Diaphorina citri]